MKTVSFRTVVFCCFGVLLFITGCAGGGSSSSSTPTTPTTPTVVPPTVASLAPAMIAAGAGATTVTVTGTGFDSSTSIQVGGVVEPTTFVNATQVTAAIPTAQLATGALLPVVALNGSATSATGTPVNLEIDNPLPAISQFVPSTFTSGSPAEPVTVTGAGFVATTVIDAAGSPRPTTYVSPSEVNVLLTVADLAAAGNLALTAVNPTPGGGTSAAAAIAIDGPNSVPGSIAVAPNAIIAGASTTATINVTGTNFIPASTVLIGGSPRATTYVSPTQLTFQISVADQATAGLLNVSVANPAPGGGSSPDVLLTIDNPIPGPITLSPTATIVGTATPTTITVTGSNFVQGSNIHIAGGLVPTTYISSTQVSFQLSVTLQATAANYFVTVVNPGPGGGRSGASLAVATASPTPVITSVTPNQFVIGSTDTQVTVTGNNLTQISVIDWNGTPLATTGYGYGNQFGFFLVANVPASLLTATGTANVTVSSPTATPAVSNPIAVSITNPPAPTLTSLTPASGPINTDTLITLNGTGFTSASTVAFNGVNLATTYVNSEQLSATLPALSIAIPGNGSFTVTTPAPGGGTTAPMVFTAYVALVNNSMVYDPANGLFYLSVPSSAGASYGNSVVSVDPATGALGTPIPVGSEPDQLAITSDGKYLWVGLNGASAVRQVELTTNIAGMQFSLPSNSTFYQGSGTVLALAALPGAPNSVVVSLSNPYDGVGLAIYDSGVLRGSLNATYPYVNSAAALQVDGSRNEIYAAAQNTYNTYTYNASGLTPLVTASGGSYTDYGSSEMQVADGILYTDFGGAYNAESGSIAGTFYSAGTTVANGPTTADTTLGRVFILENANYYSNPPSQIQVFDLSTYALAAASTIPVSAPNNYSSSPGNASTLTRWGTNGLAFRNGSGFYSLRSNLVKDLSSVSTDLSVTFAVSGSVGTGANTTYTATIANAGPADATNVALTAQIPSSGVLVAATPSVGTCAIANGVACDLGSIANGSSVTVAFVVNQLAAGSATMTAQVSGSETDPNLANNQATSTATIIGNAFNPIPLLQSISPSTILAGSGDTAITVTGAGFNSNSSIVLDGTALATTVATAGTQLTATVPAAKLASLGWSAVRVSNATPGGGNSNPLPLSVFNVIALTANHILYDPYSRSIVASVGSASTTVAGNSIVAITPDTAAIGAPAPIGSQPTKMALSDDGQVLYAILTGSASIGRFNMLTQQLEYSYTLPSNQYQGGTGNFGDLAVQPGSEDTIALDMGYYSGIALIDFNPGQQSAALRGTPSLYSGTSPQFLTPNTLLMTDNSSSVIDRYNVDTSGLTYLSSSTLNGFGTFHLDRGIAYADNGGVANASTQPATQLGVFPLLYGVGYPLQNAAPDHSLQEVFFLESTTPNSSTADGIVGYNPVTYLPSVVLPLDIPAIEGNSSYTTFDLIRWGQDGLAALTSGGHIYLLRGAAVVPQLLSQNLAATLASSSVTAITHGAGNTLLTIAGANFQPGVAITWNGTYRTTTIIDRGHVTVAIPASDLATAGSASLAATNPGASTSPPLTITIN